MFTIQERAAVQATLLEIARGDSRIIGGAITGSASVGAEDSWSDVDLAFGVRDASQVSEVLEAFTARVRQDFDLVDHLDVPSRNWIYRVFLLPNTLQVDIGIAPAPDFGALAPSFKLVFGTSNDQVLRSAANPSTLIGWAWLYALHARSSIARSRFWQAEYMISGLRNQVFALACLRHGLPTSEARGIDQLPAQVKLPLERALARSLDVHDLRNALHAATRCFLAEVELVDPDRANRLKPILSKIGGLAGNGRESGSA